MAEYLVLLLGTYSGFHFTVPGVEQEIDMRNMDRCAFLLVEGVIGGVLMALVVVFCLLA